MTTALVTGAAGFIGSTLVAALARSGAHVTAVDAFTDGPDVARKHAAARWSEATVGITVQALDLADPSAVVPLDGVDVVYHLAGRPGVRTSWGDGFEHHLTGNVIATLRLFEAVAASPVGRVVYASSSSVYGDAPAHPTPEGAAPRPVSPYGLTKLSGERIAAAHAREGGPSVVALRYFTVYGPGQRPDMAVHRLFDSALDQRPFRRYGDGSQVRDLTYVDDAVAATMAAGALDIDGFTALNVAGGSAVSLATLIDRVGELVGTPVPVEPRPAADGDVGRSSGATERAKAVLGWEPEVELDEGLGRQLAWQREARRR